MVWGEGGREGEKAGSLMDWKVSESEMLAFILEHS